MAKFSSRAWCLPRDEFVGIGAVVVCPALVVVISVGRFWICIYVCIYIFVYIYMCILLLGMLLSRGCRQLAPVGDESSWRAEWPWATAGQCHVAPLSTRSVQRRSRDNLVGFGSFAPSLPLWWGLTARCAGHMSLVSVHTRGHRSGAMAKLSHPGCGAGE